MWLREWREISWYFTCCCCYILFVPKINDLLNNMLGENALVPKWLVVCLPGYGHTTTVYLDHFDIILDNDYFDKWATSHLRPWNAMPFGTTKGPTTPLLGGWKLKLFTLLSGFRLIVRSLCLLGKKGAKNEENGNILDVKDHAQD